MSGESTKQRLLVNTPTFMTKPLCLLTALSSLALMTAAATAADTAPLAPDLSNLYRVSNAKSRSISPENFTGEKGTSAQPPREALAVAPH